MKFTLIITAGLALTSFAQEMERLMQLKQEQRARQRAAGVFDQYGTSRIARVAQTKCVNGKAGPYACDKVDLLGFLSHAQMESQTKEGNDVWGTTSYSAHDGHSGLIACRLDIRRRSRVWSRGRDRRHRLR